MAKCLVEANLYAAPRPVSNLNDVDRWTPQALESIPRIGPATVTKIIAARESLPSGFGSWDDVPATEGKRRALARRGIFVEPLNSTELHVKEKQTAIIQKMEETMQVEASLITAGTGQCQSPAASPAVMDQLLEPAPGGRDDPAAGPEGLSSVSGDPISSIEPSGEHKPGRNGSTRKGRSQGKKGQLKLEDTIPFHTQPVLETQVGAFLGQVPSDVTWRLPACLTSVVEGWCRIRQI